MINSKYFINSKTECIHDISFLVKKENPILDHLLLMVTKEIAVFKLTKLEFFKCLPNEPKSSKRS